MEDSPTYTSVRRSAVYAGIDLVLHAGDGPLEYDLVLRPGARVDDIQFELRGDSRPVFDASGRITVGDIAQWKPVAYQMNGAERIGVNCTVRQISDRVFGFTVTGHLRSDLPLIIDPVIESGQVIVGSESAEDRMLGRGADYVFGQSRRVDSANWDVFVSFGSRTTYWGGDGEEQVRGFDVENNNKILTLVGRTTSANVFTTGSLGRGTSFHGGESDAFFLEFSQGQLVQAALVGGPGADSLNDVRRTASPGYSGMYMVAGETDNPAWPRFQILGQPAGGTDAIAGWFGGPSDALVVTGGPAADSAKFIRAVQGKPEEWIVAGETDSEGFAGKSVPGPDIWVARLTSTPLRMNDFRAWGGAGEERLGGLEFIPGHGAMLAGTTSSTDLPGALKADSTFNGGVSDGFVAWLDPVDFTPLLARYLGGPGADEILSMKIWSNDLFLTGLTDSLTLSIGGLLPGSDPAGLQDGLLVHADAFLHPMAAYRAGGTGNDRFTGVEPRGWGQVDLAGWSESRPWLAELDPFGPAGDRAAGFNMTLRYSMVAVQPFNQSIFDLAPVTYTLGRDTQMYLTVLAWNELGSDGVLIARSSDPARLRISGEEAVLLTRMGQGAGSLLVESLAEEGEVDIIISGRTPGAGLAPYPERRVRVRLVPSRLFLQLPPGGALDAVRGLPFGVSAILAEVLPNGAPGMRRPPRAGIEVIPTLVSTDPDAFLRGISPLYIDGTGSYRLNLLAAREGTHVLTLQSIGIPAAPGQQVTVKVMADGTPAQSPAWPARMAVLVDHSRWLTVELAAGDRLRLTSEDPGRVGIGLTQGEFAPSVSLERPGSYQLWISAVQAGGSVGIGVEGVHQGRVVDGRIEVLPWPYQLFVTSFYGSLLPVGAFGFVTLEPRPKGMPPPEFDYQLGYHSIRPGSPLSQLGVRFPHPEVANLSLRSLQGLSINLRFIANSPGQTRLEIDGDLNGPPLTVEVVPPRLSYGPEILLPGPSMVSITPVEMLLPEGSQKNVRLRVSDPRLFSLAWAGTPGPDITVDLTGFRSIVLEAKGPPGSEGTLFVSAPGMAEIQVPIRVLEKVLMPLTADVRMALMPDLPETQGNLTYTVGAHDPRASVTAGTWLLSTFFSDLGGQKVRVTADPPGICELPAEAITGSSSLSIPFKCWQEGRVRVDVQGPGLSAYQSKLSTWLIVTRAPLPLAFEGVRVSVANGTQAQIPIRYDQRPFVWTLVSRDPARVKLSTAAAQPGSERVSVPSAGGGSVFVQAFGDEGLVWIDAERDDGRRESIPVFLYPATMGVRMNTVRQVLLPADQATLVVDARPYAVDPGSGLLLDSGEPLALRAGVDPFFLTAASSDEAVAAPVPPNPLFSETDERRQVNFKINGKGSAALTVQQPPGFTATPHGALRLTVAERTVQLIVPAAAPGLQTMSSLQVATLPDGSGSGASFSVATLTSLDPEKLLLSANRAVLGAATLETASGRPIVVQILKEAQPGDRLRVRVSAPGFAESIAEISISAAELQGDYTQGLTVNPGNGSFAAVRYGPVDPLNHGRINSSWSGGLLAGERIRLVARSGDSSVLAIATPEIDLNEDAYGSFRVEGLRPGDTELLISAPEGVVNRAARIMVRVEPWRFLDSTSSNGTRGLWTQLILRNPRKEPTTVRVESAGAAPMEFGASVTAEPVGSLSVTIPASGQSTIYWTARGPNGQQQMRLTAPDFADDLRYAYVDEARLAFEATSPLQLLVANRTAVLPFRLLGYGGAELPAAAPVRVEVRSSDPKALRVTASPVEIRRGQSRGVANVEILTPGTASLTAVTPDVGGVSGLTGVLTVVVR